MSQHESAARAARHTAARSAKPRPAGAGGRVPHGGTAPLGAGQVVELQRQVGNRAVCGLIHDHSHVRSGGASTVQRVPVQREVGEADRQWAENANAAVERLQDAISVARANLHGDASAALAALRITQQGYVRFQEKYDSAVSEFVNGVATARAHEEAFRQNVVFVGNLLLAQYSAPLAAAKTAVEGALGKVERAASMASAIERRHQAATGTTPPTTPRSTEYMTGPRELDWNALLDTTITTFDSTLTQNATLNALSDRCTESVRFLGQLRTGAYAGDNPRDTEAGIAAARAADNSAGAVRELSSIGSGEISTPALEFATAATSRLDGVTSQKLQQDLAIRWIAGLNRTQLDEIDTAEEYLVQIGLINSAGDRLAYDTGWVTTDVDEKLIQWLAQAENAAMALVGHTVEWLGSDFAFGFGAGGGVAGVVRDNRNQRWNAVAPEGTSREGGGYMRIDSYEIMRVRGESRGWEWSHSADLRQRLRDDVSFRVTPLGATGGGATAEGPVLNPPRP